MEKIEVKLYNLLRSKLGYRFGFRYPIENIDIDFIFNMRAWLAYEAELSGARYYDDNSIRYFLDSTSIILNNVDDDANHVYAYGSANFYAEKTKDIVSADVKFTFTKDRVDGGIVAFNNNKGTFNMDAAKLVPIFMNAISEYIEHQGGDEAILLKGIQIIKNPTRN